MFAHRVPRLVRAERLETDAIELLLSCRMSRGCVPLTRCGYAAVHMRRFHAIHPSSRASMKTTSLRIMDWITYVFSPLRTAWASNNDIHRATITASSASGASAYSSILTALLPRDDVKEAHPISEPNVSESQTTQLQHSEGPTPIPPTEFNDSPDARSKSITMAQGPHTHGVSHFTVNNKKALGLKATPIGLESALV